MSSYLRNSNARTDRTAGIAVGLCAAALAVTIYVLSGCVTNPDGSSSPDWVKIDIAGDEIIRTLDVQSANWEHRPDVLEDLQRLKVAIVMLDAAVGRIIADGESTVEFDTYLLAAIAIVDELVAQTEDDDLRASLSGVSASLGLVRVLAA